MALQASLAVYSFLLCPCQTLKVWPKQVLAFWVCFPAPWLGGHCLTASRRGSRSQGQLSSLQCQQRLGASRASLNLNDA